MAFVPHNLLYFEVCCMVTLGFLETLWDMFFPGLSQFEPFLNSLHTHRGLHSGKGEHWEIHTIIVLPIRKLFLGGDYFLIISNGSFMLHISWRHNMSLAMVSEATRSTNVHQTSQMLCYSPCKCLRICNGLQQPSALSLQFLTTIALKAPWASIKFEFYHLVEYSLPSLGSHGSALVCLLSAIWDLVCPPEHKTNGWKRDHSGANDIHSRTPSSQEPERKHMSPLRVGRSLCCTFCLVGELTVVLRAQGKCILTITKLEC